MGTNHAWDGRVDVHHPRGTAAGSGRVLPCPSSWSRPHRFRYYQRPFGVDIGELLSIAYYRRK